MKTKTALTLASAGTATHSFAAAKTETLAVSGGPKAVTFPLKEHDALVDWPRYGTEEKQRVCEMIDSNKFYEELPLLEKEWKEYHGAPFVKSHHNGTSVLASMYFALSLDFPPGSEILVPSQTFFATIMPMRILGFVPVFVDCDPRTANFDLAHAAKVITPRTVAMVPVHWGGLPCDLDSLMAFAKEKGLVLCEDCAHCHGASMHGKRLGTFGLMSIFSFQATKPLPSIEGGMGMYQTRDYYERATAYGHYEAPPKFGDDSLYRKYEGTGFGQKLRMHPLAAALARMQLMKLDKMNEGVNRRVRQLNDRIKHLPGLREPVCPADAERVFTTITPGSSTRTRPASRAISCAKQCAPRASRRPTATIGNSTPARCITRRSGGIMHPRFPPGSRAAIKSAPAASMWPCSMKTSPS